MTRQPVNIEDLEARAQELVDARMKAMREYAQSVNDVTTARATLQAAERGSRAAWREALRAGWTERELTGAGLPKPPSGPGRPRKSAPGENFRDPGIATGEGVPDIPREGGDPVADQLEDDDEDDLESFDPDGDGPPNVVVDR
jgi:hypothetical protein